MRQTELSPLLHRDNYKRWRHVRPVDVETYAQRCIPTPEQQRLKIETYRCRWYVRNGTLGRFLQRMGDWGRKHFPFVGYGWDGIGPR